MEADVAAPVRTSAASAAAPASQRSRSPGSASSWSRAGTARAAREAGADDLGGERVQTLELEEPVLGADDLVRHHHLLLPARAGELEGKG